MPACFTLRRFAQVLLIGPAVSWSNLLIDSLLSRNGQEGFGGITFHIWLASLCAPGFLFLVIGELRLISCTFLTQLMFELTYVIANCIPIATPHPRSVLFYILGANVLLPTLFSLCLSLHKRLRTGMVRPAEA